MTVNSRPLLYFMGLEFSKALLGSFHFIAPKNLCFPRIDRKTNFISEFSASRRHFTIRTALLLRVGRQRRPHQDQAARKWRLVFGRIANRIFRKSPVDAKASRILGTVRDLLERRRPPVASPASRARRNYGFPVRP